MLSSGLSGFVPRRPIKPDLDAIKISGKAVEGNYVRGPLTELLHKDRYLSGTRNEAPIILDERPEDSDLITSWQKLNELMAGFQARLARSGFPVDMALMRERLSRTTFHIIDPIPTRLLAAVGFAPGHANSLTGHVGLSCSYFEPGQENELELVFGHEMMHVVAGKTFVSVDPIAIVGPQDRRIEGARLLIMRHGVCFSDLKGLDDNYQHPRRFQWLHEALTQWLTLLLLGRELNFSTYGIDMKLLNHLRGAVDDDDLFIAAYFENITTDNPKERMLAWRALSKALRQAYRPGFLVRLDNYIRDNGNFAALEHFDEDRIEKVLWAA